LEKKEKVEKKDDRANKPQTEKEKEKSDKRLNNVNPISRKEG